MQSYSQRCTHKTLCQWKHSQTRVLTSPPLFQVQSHFYEAPRSAAGHFSLAPLHAFESLAPSWSSGVHPIPFPSLPLLKTSQTHSSIALFLSRKTYKVNKLSWRSPERHFLTWIRVEKRNKISKVVRGTLLHYSVTTTNFYSFADILHPFCNDNLHLPRFLL